MRKRTSEEASRYSDITDVLLQAFANAGAVAISRIADLPVHDNFGQPRFTFATREREDILGCCIHHSASSEQDVAKTAAYHVSYGEHITRNGRGCPTINYPIVINASGLVQITTDVVWQTWSQGSSHPGAENKHLIAVCLSGNYKTETPPGPQQIALARVIRALQYVYQFDDTGVFVHSDFYATTCPGRFLTTVYRAGRESALDAALLHRGLDTMVDLVNKHCKNTAFTEKDEGSHTFRLAISKFQRHYGLEANGMLDPFTQLMLLRQTA